MFFCNHYYYVYISSCPKFRNAHIGLYLGRPFRASFPRRFALPFFKGGARRSRDSNHSFQYFKQKDLLLKVAGLSSTSSCRARIRTLTGRTKICSAAITPLDIIRFRMRLQSTTNFVTRKHFFRFFSKIFHFPISDRFFDRFCAFLRAA